MSAARSISTHWLLLMALGWLMSCSHSHTQTAANQGPVLPPDFSQDVQMLVESLSPHESIWPQKVPGAESFAHKVRWQHETLFSIALWYTGSGQNWKRLAQANPNIKPKRLHIGDTILIPEELLKTRRRMPPKDLKPAPQLVKPPPQPEKVTLYGPIENNGPAPDSNKNDLPVPLETID